MVIGLDIDGVLAKWHQAYGRLLIELSGVDRFPPDWETDPNFPEVWDWDTHHGYSATVQQAAWAQVWKPGSAFWEKLKPLPETKEVLMQVNGLFKRGHSVYFLTNRHGHNVHYQTSRWLYEHGCNWPHVILAADKVPIIRATGMQFYIDDRLHTVNALLARAHDEKWDMRETHFYLYDAPHNRVGRRSDVQVVGSVKEGLQQAGLWEE